MTLRHECALDARSYRGADATEDHFTGEERQVACSLELP
jgi:hypothetical protein